MIKKYNNKNKNKNKNENKNNNNCGDAGPNIYWALGLFEEAWWTKNRSTVRKEQDQELHEQAMVVKAGKGKQRSITSAKQRKG